MVVFSNHRLGAASELLVSIEVAESMLRETAEAARSSVDDRWEGELVRWLDGRARGIKTDLDVGEIAWSPEHFERQRRFLVAAIEAAAERSEHRKALARWAAMIEAHPRDSVQVGRRWMWMASA
jgi:hypothetical protein